jgi:hypothetical protein
LAEQDLQKVGWSKKHTSTLEIFKSSVLTKLFSWLSGKSVMEVNLYLQRKLKGYRKDHEVRVLVSEDKDFGILYNFKKGQLIIGYHYGEWNSFGFPQHSCQLDIGNTNI